MNKDVDIDIKYNYNLLTNIDNGIDDEWYITR